MFRFKPDWVRAQACYEQAGTLTPTRECVPVLVTFELSGRNFPEHQLSAR